MSAHLASDADEQQLLNPKRFDSGQYVQIGRQYRLDSPRGHDVGDGAGNNWLGLEAEGRMAPDIMDQ